MGKTKVPKADREKSSQLPTNGNAETFTGNPFTDAGPPVTIVACKNTSLHPGKPFTKTGLPQTTGVFTHTSVNAGTSLNTGNPTNNSGGSDHSDEPLLDYEDYFKEEDNGRAKQKPSKHKQGKRSTKDKNVFPRTVSIGDQIGKQIAQIRATSWRKPKELREVSRQHVLSTREKNKDKLLYMRRCGSARKNEAKKDKSTEVPVGESDPMIYDLIWRFQQFKVVDACCQEPWKLPCCRKRAALSVHRVSHYHLPETNCRRI